MRAETAMVGVGIGVLSLALVAALAAPAAASEAGSSGDVPIEPVPLGGTPVPGRRTPMSVADARRLISAEYRRRFGRDLKRSQVDVLVAQWAVETGFGRSVWNDNFGNVKAGRSWTGPYVLLLTWEWHTRGGVRRKERWRAPFRAYPTPQAGISSWLGILASQRHRGALAHVLSSDPRAFGRALGNVRDGGSGYGTVSAQQYGDSVASAYRKVSA